MLDPISFIYTKVLVGAFQLKVLYGGANMEFDLLGFRQFASFECSLGALVKPKFHSYIITEAFDNFPWAFLIFIKLGIGFQIGHVKQAGDDHVADFVSIFTLIQERG